MSDEARGVGSVQDKAARFTFPAYGRASFVIPDGERSEADPGPRSPCVRENLLHPIQLRRRETWVPALALEALGRDDNQRDLRTKCDHPVASGSVTYRATK